MRGMVATSLDQPLSSLFVWMVNRAVNWSGFLRSWNRARIVMRSWRL